MSSTSMAVVDTLSPNADDPDARVKRRVVNFFRKNKDEVISTETIVKSTRQNRTKVEETLLWMSQNNAVRSLAPVAIQLDENRNVVKESETWVADDVYELGKYYRRATRWLGK